MKAALGLQLAAKLQSEFGHFVSASEEAVDVLAEGFVFRLVLYSGRDEAMLAKAAAAQVSWWTG
jgi:U3 small nucleolar RNA-associated protein 22